MKSLCCIILIIGSSTISFSQKLEQKLDQLLNENFISTEPGATALIAINGEIVYHKAFGMANLELDVKMKPDMVFEIGSITKFIEDYPIHGHHISIHHLLTHTSGIKN
tara:strand:- start:1004 stop:1327 length:324 start_codon:yes stop_codon:yes gene_type:complete